jgi:hypothetical protein
MSKNFANPKELNATQEQISARAQEIYLRNGSLEGRDLDNWLEAEKELRAEAQKPAAKNNGATAKSSQSAATASPAPVSPTSVLAETSPIASAARTLTPRKGNKREAAPAR